MPRFNLRSFGVSAALLLGGAALAAEPTSQPVKGLEPLDKAFAGRAALIEREYQEQMNAARAERIKGLRSLLDRTLENKELEAAVQIRERIKSAEDELKNNAPLPPPPPERKLPVNDADALDKALKGSAWTWAEETIRFLPDGTVANPGWTSRGLITRWKALDRRTVIFMIERGRDHDCMAILIFSPNLDAYSGFDFNGKPLTLNRLKER